MIGKIGHEIKWWFYINWPPILFVVSVLAFVVLAFVLLLCEEPTPITYTTLAEGKIAQIRATGAWENWCKIELKFDTGQVYLCSYGFIRRYSLRENHSYKIVRSSKGGTMCEEL